MKDKKSSQDFGDFLDPNNSSTPEEVNARVLNYVKSDLDPSHRKVFSKLVCIQSFVGFLTLTFCPQFDLSLTKNNFQVSERIMNQIVNIKKEIGESRGF